MICPKASPSGVDPDLQRADDGAFPPVIHVDSDAPLLSDEDRSVITERMWGIYCKPDFHFGGIQGGAQAFRIETDPKEVAVDPYGLDSPEFVVGADFAQMWVSALAHCQKRFEGQHARFKREPSAGIGAFSPDSLAIFDRFRRNCTVSPTSTMGRRVPAGQCPGVMLLPAREMNPVLVDGNPAFTLMPF